MEVAVLFTTDEVDWLWLIQIWCCCPDVFAAGVPEDDELEPALSICCIEEGGITIPFHVIGDSTINTMREYLEVAKPNVYLSIIKKQEVLKHICKKPICFKQKK